MYNSKAFAGRAPPQSWAELANSSYRGKLIFANPRVSGTGSAVASALVQNFGWPYIEKLAANKLRLASGHPAMVSTVIVGERTVGPMLDFSIFEAVAKQQQIGFSFPAEGAIAVPALAAIVKQTPNADDAHKFVDFLVSKSAADQLRAQGMYHTRKDAAPPAGWPEVSAIKTIKFDWESYKADKQAVKDRFTDLMEN